MAVSRIYPWGELLDGTYTLISGTKGRLKNPLGQNLYFSHFLGLCTPDEDGPETALIVGMALTCLIHAYSRNILLSKDRCFIIIEYAVHEDDGSKFS